MNDPRCRGCGHLIKEHSMSGRMCFCRVDPPATAPLLRRVFGDRCNCAGLHVVLN